jgi:beta-glucosidase/6-phospho-beta-glucosidase/beta-galactosidase
MFNISPYRFRNMIWLDFPRRALLPAMSGFFASFFQAGFECSSHRRRDGVRLDLIRATSHDRHVESDYRQCAELGLMTLRDGLRWHLIERAPGVYDWSSWLPALEAAEKIGLQIIWDLFHYGSPDHVHQAADDFPQRFTDFAMAALELQQSVSGRPPIVVPLNEINFLAWAVNDGYFPPIGPDEPGWFKRQLVRAGITASRAIKRSWPESRIVWAEPLIHVAPHDRSRATIRDAQQNLQGMYEAYDMLMGLAEPELGGDPSLVDVVGLNFYPHNQWYFKGPTIPMGHHEYRPLSDMLVEMAERYARPVFLSETGAEGSGRPAWLHYVCDEVRDARRRGADVQGICIYPVTAYPGWDNSRHCHVGLLSTVGSNGKRQVYEPLYEELQRQRQIFGTDAAEPKPARLRMVR